MDKKIPYGKVYSTKVSDNEKNKKYNYHNNNQDIKQKISQKAYFPKNNNFKTKKNTCFVKKEAAPKDEILNKEIEKNKVKNNYINTTPKKKRITNDYIGENYRTIIKNKKFETIESNSKKIENDDEDLVTSFERKPSELKSPDTISEDSFTSSYEEEKSNNEEKSKENSQNIKEKTNNYNDDMRDDHSYSELKENELIYIERIASGKDEEKEKLSTNEKDKNDKKKNDIQDNNNNNNNLNEKEIKQREREKKKEKYRNIEIKTKMTTRQTTYAKNIKDNNNKKIVNKSPSELIINTERESATSQINNIIQINIHNNGENSTYIPVNQRKKLLVNKIISNSKIKNFIKTNSLNILDTDLPSVEINERNEKIFLSNTKNNEKKFYAITNTDERNRYKKKLLNNNYSKDNNYNSDVTKLNLENLRFRASISNRKSNPNINFKNKISNCISQTLEISKEYIPKKRYIKDKKIEFPKEKINKKNEKDTQIILKKNSVLITKTTNNKLRLNSQNSNKIKSINNESKPQSDNSLKKEISSKQTIYEPKKLGVIRLRSAEKAGTYINYNNMSYDPNQFLNNKIKDVLSAAYSKNIDNTSYDNKNNISNKKKIYFGNTILKKNTKFLHKKFIELNNSYKRLKYKNPPYNLGLIKSPFFNSMNNIKNLNTMTNSSFDGGKDYSLRNTNSFYYSNNKVINNPLIFSKLNNKNNSLSSLTNLLNQNERYSLNNIYERTSPNNKNLLLNHNSSYEFGLNDPMKNQKNQTQLINLIGNNFLGPNIIQNNPTINLSNSPRDINTINIHNLFPHNFIVNDNRIQNTNSLSINFEDLIILQKLLKEIIISLNKNKVMENECFDFWNYYYNSSIYCQLEKLFSNQIDSNEIRININYTLMSIMICYDYSFEKDLLDKAYSTLSDILKLNYKNLILIYEYILKKITKASLSNKWVLKICSIVRESNYNDYNHLIFNGYNMTIVEKISYNTNIIIQNLRYLLKNLKSNKNDCLTNIFKKIREKTYEEINKFFRENILRITNIKGSILGSVFLQKNSQFRTLPSPYVRTKNNKEFSLVLDLDETLIYFNTKNNGEEEGVLKVRPGINEFLDEVGKYYELILFTTATQDYADVLIDAIEENQIYFDHRLYREHAIIIDNDFVKDLTRIGRPLDKIIIVDNMPQNFRLQKENGIIIKAFWGEDIYDTALLDLIPILVNVAKEGGDVRKSLVKYKDDIFKNVTSCISKGDI